MQGGKQVIGAVGGIDIPSVNDYIVGYKYCAQKYEPSMKVLVRLLEQLHRRGRACKTVAQNQIGQGSQVEFQVAGGCGLGALNAAAQAGKWGIGVDADQYKLAKHVLTSAIKQRRHRHLRRDPAGAKAGKFKGGTDVLYNLKNNGVGVGKISPKVPATFITLMNSYKAKIIAGKLKVPSDDQDVARRRRRARRASPRPVLPVRRRSLESRAMTDEPVLELRGITKRFPGVVANDHVDFDAAARRGARAPRRERRRQVDADEHPLRPVRARTRARSVVARQARRRSPRRATRSTRGSAWCTSTSC